MSKSKELAFIAIYAMLFQLMGLVVLFWIGLFSNFSITDTLAWIATLTFAGTIATISAALIILRSGPINSLSRGMACGAIAAFLFYAGWFVLFGLLPAISTINSGRTAEVPAFLLMILGIILRVSHGVPVVVGIVGGALYGAVRGRGVAARNDRNA